MKYYLNNPLAHTGIPADLPGVDLIDATGVDYSSPDSSPRTRWC